MRGKLLVFKMRAQGTELTQVASFGSKYYPLNTSVQCGMVVTQEVGTHLKPRAPHVRGTLSSGQCNSTPASKASGNIKLRANVGENNLKSE